MSRPTTNSTAAGSRSSCHGKDEIPEHILIAGAQQRRQIADRVQICLHLAPLALYGGLLHLQVGEGFRLDRELVGKAVALGLPSFVLRGAEL